LLHGKPLRFSIFGKVGGKKKLLKSEILIGYENDFENDLSKKCV